jgi:PAS domain S-box-containing protein
MKRPLREQIEAARMLLRTLRTRSETLGIPDEANRMILTDLDAALDALRESVTVVRDEDGTLPGSPQTAAVASDASEESFRSLFESSLDAVLLTVPDGQVLAANAAACRMFGRTEAEIRRVGRTGLVVQDDPRLSDLLEERAREGTARGELTFVRGDGTRFTGEISSGVFHDRHGAPRTSMVIRDITERKRTEQALSELSRFNQAILDALPANICVLDDSGTIIAVNRAWRNFAAANPPMAANAGVGANYFAVCEAVTGDDAAMARDAVRGLRAVGRGEAEDFSYEYPCHSPDTERWFLLRAARLVNGHRGRVAVAHLDITKRMQMEKALRAGEARLATIFRTSPVATAITRLGDSQFLDVNEAYETLTGYRSAELIGRTALDVRLWGDPAQRDTLLALLRTQRPVRDFHVRLRRRSGEFRQVLMSADVIELAGESCLLSLAQDITDRMQAEEALRESRDRLALALQAGTMNVWEWNVQTGSVFWSPEARAIAQVDAFDGTLAAFKRLVHPEDVDRVLAAIHDALARRATYSAEFRIVRPDGTVRWLFNLGEAEYDETGVPLRMVGIAQDITDRKRIEDALRESEARYRTVVEDQTEIISRSRADGTLLFVNDVCCRFFGKQRQELLGQKWHPQSVAEDLPMIEARLRTLSPDNPVVVVENRVYATNGEIRWMQFVNRALFDPSGQLLEVQAVGRDITDRKRAELALEALSRRQLELQEEERRRLAQELHDEIGQLLTGLRLTLDGLAGAMASSGQQALCDAQEIAEQLIRSVRDLSLNLRPPVLDDFGLLPALLWMFERYEARTQIRVKFAHSGLEKRRCAPDVETAAYRIIQEALTNVARHAGVSEVEVTLWAEKDRLLARIKDRGCGFTLEGIDTLHSAGLSGMRERTRLLGGRLTVEPTPGAGTQIVAEIPFRQGAAR